MKRRTLVPFFLAFAAGVCSGVPAASLADDTEVYVGSEELAQSQGIRPNVLIILDTSGSMSEQVPGTGKTRLENMKEALHSLLDGLNNVNIGLMRFSNPGGPVLLPVAPIDADASDAFKSGQADVLARISDGADDVEELKSTGEMDFFSSRLELVDTPAFGRETAFTRSVGASADDAEEIYIGGIVGAGRLDLTSPELEMVRDGDGTRRDGIVFRGVAIPKGAYVTAAELELTAAQNDAADTTLEFRGWAADDAGVFSDKLKPSTAALTQTTAKVVMSGVAPWTSGQRYVTADLSPVVQEIVDRPGWAEGNGLGILVTGTGLRQAKTYDSGGDAPKLAVVYGSGKPGEQRVGLRFRNLGIPQGATIDSAVLEVSPSRTLSDPVTLRIYGESVGDAEPFDTSKQSLKEKFTRKTSTSVAWPMTAEWVARSSQGQAQRSPDLSAILQDVVGRDDWCGGNDLVLLMEKADGTGWRSVYSHDGKPDFAPVLKVNYTFDKAASKGTGCSLQTLQRQVRAGNDDAEQADESGTMQLVDKILDMPNAEKTAQTVGIRFQDIPIEQGSEVLDARLVFTSRNSRESGTSIVIYGEASDNAAPFTAEERDLARRAKTTASVTWDASSQDAPLQAWRMNEVHETPNLKSIVQDVVNRSGWKSRNALSFILRGGAGQRKAYSFDDSPAQAPILRITYKARQGSSGGSSASVRQLLKQTVTELQHGGWTPIVDTLYEAARYYRAEGVVHGALRGDGTDGEAATLNTRVSHPSSYKGGTVVREKGCTDANLGAEACRTERIEGNARYVSPIEELCGSNYVILLTDGEANSNHSADLVRSMIGASSCETKLSDGTAVTRGAPPESSEECGIDLGRFLHEKDQLSSLAGHQTVSTYTIGFNLDATDPAQVHAIQFLKDLAKESGGQFRTATTAADLTETFKSFFLDILNRSTSYAAPSVSVNTFNKLYHRNDVYLSLFEPSDRIRWVGNLKKYQLRTDPSECPGGFFTRECSLGEILDREGVEAIGPDGRIKVGISSFWSSGDGNEIQEGGAGRAGPPSGDRRVLTYVVTSPPSYSLSGLTHGVTVSNFSITREMLGLDADADTADRKAMIDWVRGVDVDDEDGDEDRVEDRYSFADPLHSSPLAVTYGGTDKAPVVKLFVGTNDGGLRMIDAENGEEEWIFYPPETLSMQARLRANPNGPHEYGIDGTPTAWRRDGDGDGTIGDSSGDFVRVLFGMRRGGSHYYALDVTPGSPITQPGVIGPTYPTFLWRIDGGSAHYPSLGQTWSQPLVTKLRVGSSGEGGSKVKEYLLFGGGYHESQDTAFGPSPLGNAIYIADPETGERKYWISGTAHSPPGVEVPDMQYPIPSDLTLMDSDGDGATDRIYVGDTGGQVWRVDLSPTPGTDGGIQAVVGKLATVSSSESPKDKRKFFYPPDVVQVLDSKYSGVSRYDLVAIASGDREHPLSEVVTDRLFTFRDFVSNRMDDGNGDGMADGYPRKLVGDSSPGSLVSGAPLQGPLDGPPTVAGDLFDATQVADVEAGGTTNLSRLRSAAGWYLRLTEPGEKGLSSPVVLAGKLFLTTFTPQPTQLGDVCQLMEGGGRLYGLDVLNAEPKFNWDTLSEVTVKDRVYGLAAGIPSGAVPIFQKEGVTLLIGVGGGVEAVNPELSIGPVPTYWFQE